MIACKHSNGKECKKELRSFCNGLVINCDKYEKGSKEVKKK